MVSYRPITPERSNCVLIALSDYEIFRLRDELAATEGANVTFYGT